LEQTAVRTQGAADWARRWKSDPVQVDCTTTVMLKILDGKCKMNGAEKQVIAEIYDVIKDRPGKLLDNKVHHLIATARSCPDEKILEEIYEQRLYAEQMISRPVMKAFKAMLRSEGILPDKL
jgi:hypothetical protein